MGLILNAVVRMNHNPGLTAAEALEWARKRPKSRGSWVSTLSVRIASVVLAVWTVARHHRGQRRH